MPKSSGNMFETLATQQQAHHAQAEPTAETPAAPAAKGQAKRGNPDFKQLNTYVPKGLHKQFKRAVEDLDDGSDMSDVVTQLITNWLATQQGE